MLESQHILLAYSNICHDFSTFLGVIVIAIRDSWYWFNNLSQNKAWIGNCHSW